MNNVTYKFDISKENKELLNHNLELYNFSKNAWLNPIRYQMKEKEFGFYAYLDEKIIGGAYGYIDDYYWAFLDLLFVEETYRTNDIATNLIKQVEDFARENKCVGIKTETWSFQARGFYEKMGFTVYGQLENHPPHAIDYLLKKVLIMDEQDFPEPIKEKKEMI